MSAGMVNSGSTAFYNMLRLVLETRHEQVYTGLYSRRTGNRFLGPLIQQHKKIDFKKPVLIKAHEVPENRILEDLDFMKDRRSHVFLTYRSLRQIAAGMIIKARNQTKRNHPEKPLTQGKMVKILKQNIAIFNEWKKFENLQKIKSYRVVSFEQIMNEKEILLKNICHDLEIEDLRPEQKIEIIDKIESLRESRESPKVTWVSNSQSEGMNIHGGSCAYDWEAERKNATEGLLNLIDSCANEIYY